ncbi:hypothetical protein GWK48_04165 [Metallosphaera tengchongensis]|uniref:Uncharacterized protein n=1 Tax=Metallosphaera tengchongensis TaxID=1532350 RepID=A0A6N0NSK4_9CREN|nr:hypothetical protein [Metallosphaera tengchongensis]QKQ99691.1 hypothetical protein GWK48_04165 [Metallosphaera tengchongensis]
MKFTLAYSDDKDLVPLRPLLEGAVDRDIVLEPIRIKEDNLKFEFYRYDLVYLPLPLLNYIKDVKFISNGAKIADRIGLVGQCSGLKVCVQNSNSTEYYYMKIFNQKYSVTIGQNCECSVGVDNVNVDLTQSWHERCGSLPVVLKMIAVNVNDDVIPKIKIAIRESASIVANTGYTSQLSKELGLKGRQAVECFITKCREAELCSKNSFSIF